MAREIKRAAVLGAGVMGSGIAAHLANAQIPVYLLDIVPRELTEDEKKKGLTLESKEVRNRFSLKGLQNALNAKPAAFFSKKNAELVSVGNFEDDMDGIKECDLVIEAVVENLEVKRQLFKSVAAVRPLHTIVASNTSGISVAKMAEGLNRGFQEHFLVTHFFNPPRYMKLLEIIPHPKTKPEVLSLIESFCSYTLGKGVIRAKDTPNFIANRIGVEGMMYIMHLMLEEGLRIDEVDAITGSPMGRPNSATFRTADLVGIDTLAHVAKTVYDNCPKDERRNIFLLPDFLKRMIEAGLLGDKTGAGFYKREKTPDGQSVRKVLDIKTMAYVDTIKPDFPSLKALKGIEDPKERISKLIQGEDKAARFAWKVLADSLIYSANRIPEIAETTLDVDNAIKWGFNFQIGPFEAWDAIGVRASVQRMQAEGMAVPANVAAMIEAGKETFYSKKDHFVFFYDFNAKDYLPAPKNPDVILLPDLKEAGRAIEHNDGATLYDLGDGVACLEFHTKMNAIDSDIVQMMQRSLEVVEERFEGLVIANHAQNFCVGANIFLILAAAQNKDFDQLDKIVKDFQDANMRLRYSKRPVVAAPSGMALGGGCEILMHSDRVQAHVESYIGLVEVGVGLIPGGGGCKELYKRQIEGMIENPPPDLFPFVRKAFELIALAKVATSAQEAIEWGILKPTDGMTFNRDFLIQDAKKSVLALAQMGYKPSRPLSNIPVAGEGAAAALKVYVQGMRNAGYATDYDVVVASKLAHVITGGQVRPGTRLSEQHLLDLEREAFLSLLGDERTLARIQHMLMYNRPLRN